MKYTITATETGSIISLDKWAPIFQKIFNSKGEHTGTIKTYNIPKSLEIISHDVYDALINSDVRDLIRWNPPMETEADKQYWLKVL